MQQSHRYRNAQGKNGDGTVVFCMLSVRNCLQRLLIASAALLLCSSCLELDGADASCWGKRPSFRHMFDQCYLVGNLCLSGSKASQAPRASSGIYVFGYSTAQSSFFTSSICSRFSVSAVRSLQSVALLWTPPNILPLAADSLLPTMVPASWPALQMPFWYFYEILPFFPPGHPLAFCRAHRLDSVPLSWDIYSLQNF